VAGRPGQPGGAASTVLTWHGAPALGARGRDCGAGHSESPGQVRPGRGSRRLCGPLTARPWLAAGGRGSGPLRGSQAAFAGLAFRPAYHARKSAGG
jgi:hypothetical protein